MIDNPFETETTLATFKGGPSLDACDECGGQLAVIRGPVMVFPKEAGRAPYREGSPRDLRQSFVGCGTCGVPVPLDHPRQVALDRQWAEHEEAERTQAKQRDQAKKAVEQQQAAESQRRTAAAAKVGGAELREIDAGFLDAKTYGVRLTVAFPAATAKDVEDLMNGKLANAWLAEFRQREEYKQAARLFQQLNDAEAEAKAAREALKAAEDAYQQALAKWEKTDKLSAKLDAARQRVASAAHRNRLIQQPATDAGQTARRLYGEFVQRKKAEALAALKAEFERAANEWLAQAAGKLPALVALSQGIISASPGRPGFVRDLARPLTFDVAA